MKVPFVDLRSQYNRLKPAIDRAIQEVIDECAFVGGSRVNQFEKAFASMLGAKHCVGVGNGTDALYICMKMLGVGPGDEVITTASSWISTSETISQTGARPVFVDVDEYFNIDVAQIPGAMTSRTRAILPVHLYGQPARVREIAEICAEHGLSLIEDCAQAHLAKCGETMVGTFGVAGTFSFYPGKNLGAYGDAGAVITNDDELARRIRMYANHGALKKHEHEMEGVNSRLDGLQASILLAKLPWLPDWTEKRQSNAKLYDRMLEPLSGIEIPRKRQGCTHVYHLYVVKARDRDSLRNHLSVKGIHTGIHYPKALPALTAYTQAGYTPTKYLNAVRNQSEILSLPMYPELTAEMIEYVVASIEEFYATGPTRMHVMA